MATPRTPTDPAEIDSAPIDPFKPNGSPPVWHWIKTDCGRAKYADLARRRGPLAKLRLGWFVLIAAIRDWRLPPPREG